MNAKKDDPRTLNFGISKFYLEAMGGEENEGLYKLHVTGPCFPGDNMYVGVYTINAAGFDSLTADITEFKNGGIGPNTREAEIVDTTCWKCVDQFEYIAFTENRIVAAFRIYMEETVQKFDLQMRLLSAGPTTTGRPDGCP